MKTDASRYAHAGGTRAVFEESVRAWVAGEMPVLAVVTETQGSTYVRRGAVALFTACRQVGWLSGGCLEQEIARQAAVAAQGNSLIWTEIDTRHDEDMFSGSATGCRGWMRVVLLPLPEGWAELAQAWQAGDGLRLTIGSKGAVNAAANRQQLDWSLGVVGDAGEVVCSEPVHIPSPRRVLILGAGPEAPLLLQLLRGIGWVTTLAERRARWVALLGYADRALTEPPQESEAVERDRLRCGIGDAPQLRARSRGADGPG